MKLTQKQKAVVLDVFNDVNPGQAYFNHYKCKNLAVAGACATRLLKTAKVQAYLKELHDKAESDKIMSVQERKERLSEIARARLTDYQETGLDSGYISIGKDSPNTAAIAGIESATKFDENGNTGTLFTKVKLHSPIQAIDLLNKMDKIYSDNPVVNVDNRKLIVVTNSEKARLLTEAIAEGEGTE